MQIKHLTVNNRGGSAYGINEITYKNRFLTKKLWDICEKIIENKEQKMKKTKKLSILFRVVAALFICVGLSGCGDDGGDGGGDGIVQYLMYQKKGNVRDGYYIEIIGLNIQCDDTGTLNVDLNELWTKYQGKVVIPSEIEGLPVKKVSFDQFEQKRIIGGQVDTLNKVSVRFVTNGDEFLYYLNKFGDYLENIKELTIPAGVEKYEGGLNLQKLTIPLETKKYGNAEENIYTTVDETKVINEIVEISRFSKSTVFPNNVKKIDLGQIFNTTEDNGGVRDDNKGYRITCSPDAEFFISRYRGCDKVSLGIIAMRNIQPGDIYINGTPLVEIIINRAKAQAEAKK